MFQHVCAWCRYTRGRFERTHGDVLSGHTEFRSVSHTNTHTLTHTNTHNTTKHNTSHTQHHTEKETETDRDRERRQGPGEERRRKRREKTREEKTEDKTRQDKGREKIFFLEWWCMAVFCWCSDFLVNSVCARFLSLLNSIKYDSSLISVPLGQLTVFEYLRINFSIQLQFFF